MKRRILYLAALAFTLFAIWGCSQFADSTKCTTDTVLTASQVRALFPNTTVICGDRTYAEVNPEFAGPWHSYTGKVMSLLGMAGNWSQQFDCNRFANVKLAVIYVRFLVDTWHARNPGAGPASGEYWYLPDRTPGAGHAILVTIERGQVTYRDIYSAKALALSPTERASAYLIKF